MRPFAVDIHTMATAICKPLLAGQFTYTLGTYLSGLTGVIAASAVFTVRVDAYAVSVAIGQASLTTQLALTLATDFSSFAA
jgi:hypothetical protein